MQNIRHCLVLALWDLSPGIAEKNFQLSTYTPGKIINLYISTLKHGNTSLLN